MSSRDDFKAKTRRKLAERVGYRCSFPKCYIVTVGPMDVSDESASVGVAAHIAAAAPGGPRYDPEMSSEERSSAENGIWLCQNHARIIDVDPLSHPANTLRAWKLSAESEARKRLVGTSARSEDQLPGLHSRVPWQLGVAACSLHVDLMRLFVVVFGDTTNAANRDRLEEFRDIADDQAKVLDHQVSALSNDVSDEMRSEAISVRANLGKSLLALKRSTSNRRTAKLLAANLRDVSVRIKALLVKADPELVGTIEAAVGRSLETVAARSGIHSWVDSIAARRFQAQNAYLRQASDLGSIANDFGQALGVPYFLIDARILTDVKP